MLHVSGDTARDDVGDAGGRGHRELHVHQRRPAGPPDAGQDGHQRQRRHRGADGVDAGRQPGPRPGSPGRPAPARSPTSPVSAGTYTLSESGGPAGYTAAAWTCTGGTVTGGTVAVANGADVTCTINNNDQPAHLTLVKTVTNDNGGTALPTAWTLTAAGPTTGITGPTGSTAVTNVTVNAGNYALTESGGPAGYAAVARGPAPAAPSPAAPSPWPNGGNVTCTINNNDQPAHAHPGQDRHQRQRRHRGSRPTGHSPRPARPPASRARPARPRSLTPPVNAGSYALSEAGPAGYTAAAWTCTGGTLTGATCRGAPTAATSPARSPTTTSRPT